MSNMLPFFQIRTTAIGMDVSTELGASQLTTVAVIIITGVFGNIRRRVICKLFHITEPVAKGVGMEFSSAHAIGTAKAMEMGEVEGAIGSLSIAVTGLLTVCCFHCRKSILNYLQKNPAAQKLITLCCLFYLILFLFNPAFLQQNLS